MPNLTIQLYTTLRDRVGKERVEMEGGTVAEAVRKFTDSLPADLRERVLDEEGHIRRHFTLTLNATPLDPRKLDGVSFQEGDTLHIFPPIAGGKAGSSPPPMEWIQ